MTVRPTDLPSLLPVQVRVSFPRTDDGVISKSPYDVTVTLASLALTEFAGVLTHSGTKLLRSSCVAAYVSAALTNASELADLAEQIATDFYRWQLGKLDLVLAGIEPWELDTLHDSVEWVHDQGRAYTRIQRGEWRDFGEMLAAGTDGAIVNLFLYQEVVNLTVNNLTINNSVTYPVSGLTTMITVLTGVECYTRADGSHRPRFTQETYLLGAGYGGTSTTSLAIGTGSKTFTTQAGMAYQVGARVRASSDADPTNWMEGLVTSYSSTSLELDVDLTGGSGTHADWNLDIAGERGAAGATGAAGADGADGVGVPTGGTAGQYLAKIDGTDYNTQWVSMPANLVAIGALVSSANSFPIFTGSGTASTATITSIGLDLVGASTQSLGRSYIGAAASGANTDISSVYLNNTGLKAKDTDASHGLTFKPGSNLTADRTLTVATGDADRTLTLSADATISGTNTGDQTVPAAAAQSDQETATSTTTYVSPGRQKYHPSAAKAWIVFDSTTATPTISASYGVSSLTDNGTGDITVNFSTSFSSANYAFSLGAGSGATGGFTFLLAPQFSDPTSSAFRFRIFSDTSGTLVDRKWISASFFGDQ